jgi:hypothetical protein
MHAKAQSWIFFAFILAMAYAAVDECRAQPAPAPPAIAKAEYLFRFLQYVSWPKASLPELRTPLVMGVMGDDAFADFLRQRLVNREAQGRTVLVRALLTVDGEATGVQRAHVLFFAPSLAPELPALIRQATGPVLIVTETEGGLELGSVINLVTRNHRLAFEVSLPAARARSLSISAKLLSVASLVKKSDAGGSVGGEAQSLAARN